MSKIVIQVVGRHAPHHTKNSGFNDTLFEVTSVNTVR